MKRAALFALFAAVFSFGLGASLAPGCKGVAAPTPAQLEAAAPVAAFGCTSLEAVDSSGVLQTICALLPDIIDAAAIIVPLIAMQRGEACATVGDAGNALCLSNAQRLQIIYRLRALDAGF